MNQPSSQRLLYQLVHSCIQLQKTYNKQHALDIQCSHLHIQQLLKLIDFKEIGIEKDRGITQGIGICNIYEHFPLRISVYYLPKGQTMKLHDHPKIEVINYLFSGTMEARMFTHIQDNLYRKQVKQLNKGNISFIDGKRSKNQNLHQFYAMEASYFLDIIFPDYSGQRMCRFYEEEEEIDEERVKLRQIFDYNPQFTYLF